MRERMTTAYEEARVAMRRAAERNKRYYDVRVRAKEYRKGQWVYYFNPRKFVGRQDKWERKYTGPFLIVGTPSPVTVQLQRSKGAKTMTVHVDKVKPFLGKVPKSWLAAEPSSEVRELPERADDQETLVKAPYELDVEPELEEQSVPRIDYEVDGARPLERPRREVRAPKYLDEYVRLIAAKTTFEVTGTGFLDRMPFLSPNEQCESTEGISEFRRQQVKITQRTNPSDTCSSYIKYYV